MQIKRDQLITSLIIATLLLLFGLTVIRPDYQKRKKIKAELKQAKQLIEQQENAVQTIGVVLEEIKTLEVSLSQVTRRIASENEHAKLLGELTALLAKQKMFEQSMQTKPMRCGQYFNISTIRIAFRCTFDAAFAFVQSIEKMERLVQIKRFEVIGNPDKPDELLRVKLDLNAFFESSKEVTP